MSRRPGNIDLSGATMTSGRFHMDLPSPRVGEAPPALSPLDAFAQQSRLLAQRFEESKQKGRRISRLDHLEVATEINKRPTFFRGISEQSTPTDDREEDDIMPLPNMPVKHNPTSDRPVSQYPTLGNPNDDRRSKITSNAWPPPDRYQGGYFGLPMARADSPEPFEHRGIPQRPAQSSAVPSLSGSVDSLPFSHPRTGTDDSYVSRQERMLVPPYSPPPAIKKSFVQLRNGADTSEDELVPSRKLSGPSNARPRSPFTPNPNPNQPSRSPSIRSDHSAFQDDFRRPSFNFSRPRSGMSNMSSKDQHHLQSTTTNPPSQESRPSHDLYREPAPFRKDSGSSNRSHPLVQQYNRAEASSPSECGSSVGELPEGAPSYIYAKYSLPRGRTVERDSLGERASWIRHQFKWEEPPKVTPQSSPILPSGAFTPQQPQTPPSAQRQLHSLRPPVDLQQIRSHSADAAAAGAAIPKVPFHRSTTSTPSINSLSTDQTIRQGHTRNSPSQDILNMTPEQHLEKGIECHSNGSLSKSTYHLRLAARAGNPTGMLLYALACRHGWGMRANQTEGVSWLKKAVDSSSLEMLDEHDVPALHVDGTGTALSSKSRKAQFALAIYELGMSYMNGWGTHKDKTLALRCFEVAGSWGDCDALAEAGFCYTEGIGCKKDLKKAAAFYRKAAEGGMSMAGNSWIYKQKYMGEPAPAPASPSMKSPDLSAGGDKPKPGGRSRAKSIFGRKKAGPTAAATVV